MHSLSDLNCPFREVVLEASMLLKNAKNKLSVVTEQLNYLENKLNYYQTVMLNSSILTESVSFNGTEAQPVSSDFRQSERVEAPLMRETAAEVSVNIKKEPPESNELEILKNLVASCSRGSSSSKRPAQDGDNRPEGSSKHRKYGTCVRTDSSRSVETFRDISIKTEGPECSPSCDITAGNANGTPGMLRRKDDVCVQPESSRAVSTSIKTEELEFSPLCEITTGIANGSSKKSDQSLSLLSAVFCTRALRALKAIGFAEPELQAQVILPMLSGRNMVVSRENSSGKTAAFLIAAVEILCQQKLISSQGTRVLILCKSNERVFQISTILERLKLSHSDFTSGMLVTYHNLTSEREMLRKGVHIVVAMLGRLETHLYSSNESFNKVQCIVFDNLHLSPEKFKKFFSLLPSWRQVTVFTTDKIPPCRDMDEILGPNVLYVPFDNVESSPVAERVNHYYVYCEVMERTFMIFQFLKKWHHCEKIIMFFNTPRLISYFAHWLPALGVPVCKMLFKYDKEKEEADSSDFLTAKTGVLLASPSHLRFLDIDGVTMVIHYDCSSFEDYFNNIRYAAHRVNDKGKSLMLLDKSQDVLLQTLQENGVFLQEYNFATDEREIEDFHEQLQKVVSCDHTGITKAKKALGMATNVRKATFQPAVAKTFGLRPEVLDPKYARSVIKQQRALGCNQQESLLPWQRRDPRLKSKKLNELKTPVAN